MIWVTPAETEVKVRSVLDVSLHTRTVHIHTAVYYIYPEKYSKVSRPLRLPALYTHKQPSEAGREGERAQKRHRETDGPFDDANVFRTYHLCRITC